MKLRTLMRANVNYMEQSRFVQALNEEFGALSEIGRFATAVVATYWAPTRYVTLSNAGHPPPMWYVAKRGEWRVVETVRGGEAMSNIPLGIAPPATYDQTSLHLAHGDLLLFYTDALIEALNPRTGERMGDAGLRERLARVDVADPSTVLQQVAGVVEEYTASAAPDDDITLMLLSPNNMTPRRSLGDWMTIGRRWSGMFVESVGSREKPFPWPQMNLVNIGGAIFGGLNRRYGRMNEPERDAEK